ncbi:UNVERIFIED_CONTAM: hypothetical protein FKN15_049282 [Acipenser sinensis]
MEVSSPKKKKKCKSHGESLEKAKKPRSAYLLYYFDIHQSMQQEYPHLPQSEINKRISENWKRLNVADKGYYLERAKLEKQGIDPDSQVAGPSADVPGFRKILPRSNYVLIPKSTVPEESVAQQVDLCLRQGDPDSEAAPQTLSLVPLFSPMGLGSEVELPEHCIAIEGLTDETAAALSQSGALQEILSQFSSTTQGKEPAAFVLEEEPAVELVEGQAYGAVSVVIEETLVDGSGTVAALTTTGQQTRDEGHLVTVIPNQSIKYTRRGRGSCRTPGCLFSYVTRHKPPQCPQCGKHLGGKWVPSSSSETSGKKALAKAATTGNKVPSKKQQEASGETSRPSLETFEAVTQLIVSASSYEMNSEPQWKEVVVEETAEVVSALQSGKEETAEGIMKKPENNGTKEAGKRGNAITRQSTAGGTNCKTPTLLIHSTQSTSAKSLPPVTSAHSARSKGREKPAVVAPKRPVRAILPAPAQSCPELGSAYVQWVPVPPNKLKDFEMPKNNSKPARGRGKCKNPSCDYVYKNRHKPLVCPSCGWDLTKDKQGKKPKFFENISIPAPALLDPYQPLSAAQQEVQRQSTLQLLRKTVLIPESEGELAEAMALIQELNGTQVVLSMGNEETIAIEQTGWPRYYESAATQCALCDFPLFKGGQSSIAGQEDCWLLTDSHIQTATVQLKICLNPQCLALHSFNDIHMATTGNKVPSKKQQEASGETSRPSLETFEAVTQLIVSASSYEMNSEPQWKEVVVEETAEVVSALQSGKEETAEGIMKKPENNGTKEAGKRGNAITRQSTAGGTNCKTPTLLIHSTQSTSAKSLPPVTSAHSARSKGREKPAVVAPKRPVRAILPAPAQSRPELGAAYVQWVAVPPNKLKDFEMPKNNSKPAKRSCVKVSGLKPNTLKQLGHPVKQTVEEQSVPSLTDTNQNASSEKGVKILSILSYKHNPSTSLDLGLSTARGRGKCKNPSCDYVYKNRHKPLVCPSCGWDLTKDKQGKKPKFFENISIPAPALLDPYQPLSAAQQEVQRQSTLQLLRKTVLIPESEGELAEAMALIQELNGTQVVLSMGNEETIAIEQTGWPRYYESAATQCALCDFPLFKGGQSSIAGQEDCWLLTDSHIQTATVQLKICLNPQCLALHSFNDIHMVNTLNPSEISQIQELLYNGYWAFECFTIRDYNDMICGVCGIAPKMEIAQRNTENVLHLKNVQFTWPDFLARDEVNVDDFWSTMEGEAIEQAAFPSSMPVIKFDASIIAPFFPPLMRNFVVVNTEKDKYSCEQTVKGDIGDLVRLIHTGTFKPDQISSYSEKELRDILNCCDIPHRPEDTQEQMRVSLLALYAYIQNGTAKQHPPDLTGGKLYKVCPHQVVCGSKYIVRGESARDHVDLLVSSRYWPPVYAVDMAKQVAVSTDVWYPELAAQMWGKNQGCFSDPMELPEYVSCIELQDQQYNMDLTVPENSTVHPITKSSSRWIVCSEVDQEVSGDPLSQHHSLSLCRELEPYSAIISTIQDSKTSYVRQQPFSFDNAAYYYLYNRLIDFLTSKDIVNNQIADILQTCQPGEVVIRDSLYRLGVAQINTEVEPEEVEVEQQ